MKRLIIIFLFIIFANSLPAQIHNSFLLGEIDSLRNELNENPADTKKIQLLRKISGNFLHINSDSSIFYAEKLLKVSESANYIRGQFMAMGIIVEGFIYQGNLPKAMEKALEGLDIKTDLPDGGSGVGRVYNGLGDIYKHLNDDEKARYYFTKLIGLDSSDRQGVAFGYYQLAGLYEKANKLDSALIYLEKSVDVFAIVNASDNPYLYDTYPGWYNLRAKVYLKQDEPELALADLRTTLAITLKSEEAFHTSNTFNDISTYYLRENLMDSSIFYAEKAIAEASKISYSQGILSGSKILAGLYEPIDSKMALYYYKLATETQNQLYSAGNIQTMRDMIAQNERRQQELEIAETAYQNRIRTNAFLGSTFTLIVIAIFLYRNNRMKQKAKQNIEKSYEDLKTTQTQLIHSEKMASLGELTAGIAHEIQNPLNFVNNFSEVNTELVEEQKEEIKKGNLKEAEELANDIIENEKKIIHHGKRAEEIVKSMLQHSRGSEGVKEPTNINAMADEYLRLAYHGFRAKDKSFNVDFKLDLDESLPKINVVPQDIGRVLLNLINNAFYAVSAKALSTDGEYKPTVTVSTKHVPLTEGVKGEGKFEIRVKDNGLGIPDEIKDKIFQPFFTTKSTGQGTGLGLSLSYDIITKGHGGKIEVKSKERVGTEFLINIPLK